MAYYTLQHSYNFLCVNIPRLFQKYTHRFVLVLQATGSNIRHGASFIF